MKSKLRIISCLCLMGRCLMHELPYHRVANTFFSLFTLFPRVLNISLLQQTVPDTHTHVNAHNVS